MSSTTSASISIEGKNYWILKTLPIDPYKVFNSKMLLNLTLVLPVLYFSLIILYFSLGLTLVEVITLAVISTITSLVSAKLGLLLNLKFPNLDAINDVVIVKRSASVMIAILGPMALIFGCTGLYSLVSSWLSLNILIIIIIVLLLIVNIVEKHLLQTWGIKRFKEIY
jgi:ABC-2 type transport system permease protein